MVDPGGDLGHLGFFHAAGGDGRGADADAAAEGDLLGVEGDAVFVHGDGGLVEGLAGDFAVEAFRAQIDEHEVIIRAAADDAVAEGHERGGEGLGVFDDLLRVGFEVRLEAFAEAHGLGGDDVHERAALHAREDLALDLFEEVLVVGEDHAATGTAQAFVRGGGDEVGVFHRRRMGSTGDEAGDVGHIDEEVSADALGDLAHLFEVDDAWVSAGSGGDHLGLLTQGDFGEFVVVDALIALADAVLAELVKTAAEVGGIAVGQMTAVGEVHAEHFVTGLQHAEIDGGIGLGAGMRLHVGKFGAEKLAGAVDGELLDLVHFLAATIPAFAGVTFGVFVREAATLSGHDGATGEIFARDELDVVLLTMLLTLDDVGDGGIGGGEDAEGVGLGVHFIDAAAMTASSKGGGEPGVRDGFRGGFRRGFAGEAKNVRGVVLAGDLRSLYIAHEGGLDAGVAVRGDADADAGGANEDARIGAAVQNTLADHFREVRVVHAVHRVRADVLDQIARRLQMRRDGVFEHEAAVVGTNGEGAGKVGGGHGLAVKWVKVVKRSRRRFVRQRAASQSIRAWSLRCRSSFGFGYKIGYQTVITAARAMRHCWRAFSSTGP